jgi:hypothetical protein
MSFTCENVSISGAPPITFHFAGSIASAELAGAQLAAIAIEDDERPDDDAEVVVTGADGFILARMLLRRREGRTTTENVMDVGSALLWSHWRWLQAKS